MLQSKEEAEQQAASARAEAEAAQSEVAELQSSAQNAQSAQGAEAAVHPLVELMYFATVSLRPILQLRTLMGVVHLSTPLRGSCNVSESILNVTGATMTCGGAKPEVLPCSVVLSGMC